ncbi:DUF4179 domain-containing protein [Lysinibacillus irui]|uniref:DUF4179 domain-containing protein n=3 Tax=Lysinibacillus TaxID=400634 RepID=A0AAJ5URX1_9BACI|nr:MULTISPECIES: DUF4179 domain-containing protein [Lysinibacillus]WDV05263.1 DUF4179 domain-containing protein [Lysinibacillus irui]
MRDRFDYDKFAQELTQIKVPQEQLVNARLKSMNRYHSEKRIRQRIWQSLAIVTILIVVLVTSIRVSPALANSLAKIPIFAPIVHMINDDKGVQDIVNNQYYEELGVSQSKNELTFTLQGVIADETGMILPYTLTAPFDIQQLDIKNIHLKLNGEIIPVGLGYGWYHGEETTVIEENFQVTFNEPINYQGAQFELVIQVNDQQQTTFSIPFSVKKPIAKAKVYVVNKELSFEGQHITVKSVSISPLRTGITMALDPHNTMRILGFEDIRMLDERGEAWTTIQNGLTATGTLLDGEATFYLQSNYFREPKQLSLAIGKVVALPVGQDYIEVDFNKNKVLAKPPLAGLAIQVNDQMVTLHAPKHSQDKLSAFLGRAVDAQGTELYSNGSSHSGPKENQIVQNESYDLKGIVNPVRIYFNYYENYLEGTEIIDLPLN